MSEETATSTPASAEATSTPAVSNENVNPNVEVTNIDETTTNGQNAYSFNEIEQALKQRERNKESKQRAEKAKHESTKEGVAKKEEKLEEKKEKIENTEEDKKVDKAIKKLRAKYGDDILELHPDTLIPHKVDGKVEEIPVKELLNSYAGKVAYDKRFQELDVEKKSHAKQIQEWKDKTREVDTFVTEFFNKASSGKAIEALQMLAAGCGQDPMEFTRSIKAGILREYENYANMTEEERRRYDAQQEAEYYDRQIASKKQEFTMHQAREVEIKNIDRFCAKYNVSFDEFERTYNTLAQNLSEQGISPSALKVADVEKYYIDNIAYSAAKTSLGNLRPEWQDKAEIVQIVADYVKNNVGVTPSMVDAYVIQTFDIKPSKSVAQVLQHESGNNDVSIGLQKKLNVPKRPMFFSEF